MPEPCPLTARQHELLLLVARGLTQKQIALQLGITVSTIRTQLGAAYGRLGASNAAQAVVVLMENGWLEEDADFPLPSPGLKERLGLDRRPGWWRSSDTGDDPLSRLFEHMALVPDKPPPSYRVVPPSQPEPPAAAELAHHVPRIRLTPDASQPDRRAS